MYFIIMQSSAIYPDSDKIPQQLAQAAITAALTGAWQEAIKLNEKILAGDKTNVEALNRLARAQMCMGEHQKAHKSYKKVLEIDPYNIIALKNMEKLEKKLGKWYCGTCKRSHAKPLPGIFG